MYSVAMLLRYGHRATIDLIISPRFVMAIVLFVCSLLAHFCFQITVLFAGDVLF